jgi:hypothetical protein
LFGIGQEEIAKNIVMRVGLGIGMWIEMEMEMGMGIGMLLLDRTFWVPLQLQLQGGQVQEEGVGGQQGRH